jgi:hypothetical protein
MEKYDRDINKPNNHTLMTINPIALMENGVYWCTSAFGSIILVEHS